MKTKYTLISDDDSIFGLHRTDVSASLVGMQETWISSLGWEDPLEKGMATYSSILAWEIPWTEEPDRATIHRVVKSQT